MPDAIVLTADAKPRTAPLSEPRSPQPWTVGVAAAVLVLGAVSLTTLYGPRHAALFLIGGACGVVLYHAAFGFTAAFRAFVTVGDGRGIRAEALMLAFATVLFAPILALGLGLDTEVVGSLAPAGVSVIVGAFVFAIGMQLGGGCGSGTLFHIGAGATPIVFTLAGFVAGSVIATFHMPFWSSMPSLGALALSEMLGWPVAIAVQLVVLALVVAATRWIERRRGASPLVAPRPARRGWRRVVQGPWPLVAGAIALALLNALTLVIAGHPWTITWAFALWGAKALQAVGVDLSSVPFWSGDFQQAALAAPVIADETSVMDFGIMLGALLAAGLAGRFAPARRVPARIVVASVVGGLLLGYGARISYGCTIGALFSGIASTSVHGWLWAAGALAGTPIGVRLRTLAGR